MSSASLVGPTPCWSPPPAVFSLPADSRLPAALTKAQRQLLYFLLSGCFTVTCECLSLFSIEKALQRKSQGNTLLKSVLLADSGKVSGSSISFCFYLLFYSYEQTLLFSLSLSAIISQEVSVPCPGQQRLPGGEEEECRGAGEGAARRGCHQRARSASQ